MQVPAFLFGSFRDVKAACQHKITLLERGASWDELTGNLVDTREFPGFYVLDGPDPLSLVGENFHFFAPVQVIRKSVPSHLPADIFATLFESMIATCWGFLALLGARARPFLDPPGHQQRFLHLLVRWWDELAAEEPRWTIGPRVTGIGLEYTGFLWDMPTHIQSCLLREGLPKELISRPVPRGGMAALVAKTRAGMPPTREKMH